MNSARTKVLAILGGGVLVASAAYGIGSEAGGGSASAEGASKRSTWEVRAGRGGAFDSGALASRLGVDEERLRAALEEVRGELEPKDERPDGLAAELAAALGVSEERVREALAKLRPGMGERRRIVRRDFTAALATELGVDADRVRSVFRQSRPHPGEAPPSPAAIAEQLGVSEEKLEAAMEKLRPRGDVVRRVRPGPPERLVVGLARELDLDAGKVRDALEKLHARHEAEHRERHAAFTRALAEELGIPQERVEEALPAPGPAMLRGQAGPGGPFAGPPGGPGGPPR